MGKRGPKPNEKVRIRWSPDFFYAIGLMVTDGCLYNDQRHMSLTSKDFEQAKHFKKCLGLKVKIGRKANGISKEKKYFHVQFGDVIFYKFLVSIGLSQAKCRKQSLVSISQKNIFLIICEDVLMETGRFIHIGIRDGDQATCFILNLFRQVLTI